MKKSKIAIHVLNFADIPDDKNAEELTDQEYAKHSGRSFNSIEEFIEWLNETDYSNYFRLVQQ